MIQHIVLFRWHDDAAPAAIDEAIAAMRSLAEIGCVSELRVGPNRAKNDENYSLVLSMRLPDVETLNTVFRPHPAHKRVSAAVRPIMAGKMLVDLELD